MPTCNSSGIYWFSNLKQQAPARFNGNMHGKTNTAKIFGRATIWTNVIFLLWTIPVQLKSFLNFCNYFFSWKTAKQIISACWSIVCTCALTEHFPIIAMLASRHQNISRGLGPTSSAANMSRLLDVGLINLFCSQSPEPEVICLCRSWNVGRKKKWGHVELGFVLMMGLKRLARGCSLNIEPDLWKTKLEDLWTVWNEKHNFTIFFSFIAWIRAKIMQWFPHTRFLSWLFLNVTVY